MDLLLCLFQFLRDSFLLLFKSLSLNLKVVNEGEDILFLIVHFGPLLPELVDLVDLVLLLRESDDGVLFVFVLLLFGLLLLGLLILVVLSIRVLLCILIATSTFSLADLLDLLEVGADDVVLVGALGTEFVELGHEVVLSDLDLVDVDLLVPELGTDAVDLPEDDALVLSALSESLSQLVVSPLH